MLWGTGYLGEHSRMWRDNQLSVRTREGLAETVRLAGRYEEHLIGVPHDFITPDVPDEQSLVRNTDLEF